MRDGTPSEAISGVVTAVSVSHHTADVERIEAVAVDDPRKALEALASQESVEEAFYLQTCNRVEWYVVTTDPERGRAILEERIDDRAGNAFRWFGHEDALEHLLRVGAGLESMVVGEAQILGQLSRAYEEAVHRETLGEILDEAVWHALRFGRHVRTVTDINEGTNSVSRAAVEHVRAHADLASSHVVVVGAGEMGTLAAEALVDENVEALTIANRTIDRARAVANELPADIDVIPIEAIGETIETADAVVTATASDTYILQASDLSAGDEMVVVDIGQPRDVEPSAASLDAVHLFDLDDLREITATTSRTRADAVRQVEGMIDDELAVLDTKLKRNQADEVIAEMYAEAERIKDRELAEALSRLEHSGSLDPEHRSILQDFADALVGSIMAAPTKSLRDAAEEDDWETIQVALRLFDPAFPTNDAPDSRDSTTDRTIPVEDDA